MKKRINWKVFIVCLGIVYFVAFIGSLFVDGKTNSAWYNSVKPVITPPGWVFPIVWNILFFLIALSLYLVWIYAKPKDKKGIVIIFGINLFLNVLWSFFYFTLENPFFAFLDIVLLWASIVGMMIFLWRVHREATPLIVPYFIWVSFATVLNWLSLGM